MSKVSVIIPVYNIKEYIDGSVKSAMNQTYRDIEIILVDDGATDGSGQMCDEYAQKDDRIRVIHKKNGGLMSAWSEGARKAESEYLCFIDGDDWVDEDMIEKLLEHTLSDGKTKEIISSNYIIEKKNERKKATQTLPPGIYENQELDKVKLKLLGEETRPVTLSRCMKLISKQLVLDNMHYLDNNVRMGEDVNITLPCLLDAERLVVLEGGYFYHYRTVTSSISHMYNKRLLDNVKLNYRTFLAIMEDKKVPNAKEQMDREYVMLLFLVMKNELRQTGIKGIKNSCDIFSDCEIRKLISNTPVSLSEKSNRLLYAGMKHPVPFFIFIIKMILRTYDSITN